MFLARVARSLTAALKRAPSGLSVPPRSSVTVSSPDAGSVSTKSGLAGNASTDTSNTCAELGGSALADKNTILGVWSSNVGIRTRQRFTTTYNVSGYSGGGTNMPALQTYIAGNNVMGASTVLSSTTTAYVSTGATCGSVSP